MSQSEQLSLDGGPEAAEPRACPWCHGPLTDRCEECPSCGLTLGDLIGKRLVAVDSDIRSHLGEDLLRRQKLDLLLDTHRRLADNATFRSAISLPPPPPDTREFWGPTDIPQPLEAGGSRLRSALLGLGASLLIIAAIVFATVAWPRLDNAGRAGVLVGVTSVMALLAIVLRKRLPATAETFNLLFVVFALVDWYALRNAGVAGGIGGQVWWAIGSVVIAMLAAGMALAFGFSTSRLAAATLVQVGGALVIAGTVSTSMSAALSLTALATLVVLAAVGLDRPLWRPAAGVLGAGFVLFMIGAASYSADATLDWWSPYPRVWAAMTIAALTVPLLCGRLISPRLRSGHGDAVVAAISLCLGAAAVTLGSQFAHGYPLLVWSSVVGTIAIAANRQVGRGATVAALPFLAIPAGGAAVVAAAAGQASWSWFGVPWTGSAFGVVSAHPSRPGAGLGVGAVGGWSTIAILAVLALAGLVRATSSPRRPMRGANAASLIFAAAAVTVGVAMVPLVAGMAIIITAVTALALAAGLVAGSALLSNRHRRVADSLVVLAFLSIAWGLGWAAADRWLTIGAIGSSLLIAAAGTRAHRRSRPRAAFASLFIILVAAQVLVTLLAMHVTVAVAAFSATLASGAVLIVSVHLVRGRLLSTVSQQTAMAALVVMVALAYNTVPWGNAAVTATAPIFAIAALGSRRHTYRWFAAVAALLATLAWLATANVSLLEAYTMPAALFALSAGYVLRKTQASSTSWFAYGPGLTIVFAPSLFLAITDHGASRPQILFVAAAAVVGIGAWRRLQAPIAMGAITVLVLAIDILWPVAARLERWVLLSIAGALFIWLGATVEGRLRQIRRIHDDLRQLH